MFRPKLQRTPDDELEPPGILLDHELRVNRRGYDSKVTLAKSPAKVPVGTNTLRMMST